MPVFFSIIIPTYNRAHLISDTISSVLKQEYEDYELIIVDDGSTDNTKQTVETIIHTHPDKKIKYIYQVNKERAAARNTGLKNSNGDYVIYFDSDDTLYSNHLLVANDFILKNNFPELLHLRYDLKNGNKEKYADGPVHDSPPNKELIFGNFLSCNGMVIKKQIALDNMFNEDRALSAAEDWELWLRLAVQYPIYYVNTITSSIINHDHRSVLVADKAKLINRFETLIACVLSNEAITSYYKNDLVKFKASCYSYVSLHLALTKQNKRPAFDYLLKSISISPSFIFKKRFFAIIKHILI